MKTRVSVGELPPQEAGNRDQEFSVSLRVALSDASRLWSAAADMLLQGTGLEMDDVIDTIGPKEDPSLTDCLAVLVAPEKLAGCVVRQFAIDESLQQENAQRATAKLAA